MSSGQSKPLKFFVAVSDARMHEMLCELLRVFQSTATILESSNDQEEARRVLEEHSDILLTVLDLDLSDPDEFERLAKLRSLRPSMAIVVVSDNYDREAILKAYDLGGVHVLKPASRGLIFAALRLMFSGIPTEVPQPEFWTGPQ